MKRIKQLEVKIEEARELRKGPKAHKDRPRIQRTDSNGNQFCYKCETFKVPTAFYVDATSKCGLRSNCKVCDSKAAFYYGSTFRGALKRMLQSAKARAGWRSTVPGREEAGRFELDLNSLLNLWLKQRGRCAYSGLVMNVESFTAWRFSLERRDNNAGYVPNNVVFICAEFNTSDNTAQAKYHVLGSAQWSRSKVDLLPRVINTSNPVSKAEINRLASGATVLTGRGWWGKREMSPNGDLICTKCYQRKQPHEFALQSTGLFGRCSYCKKCRAHYLWSFRGFFKSRLDTAKRAAKYKAENGRKEAGVFDLSFSDVVELYTRQRGLCFYSGVRLTLKPLSEWMCSLERLDNAKGYTLNNVVLICSEFQTSDRSWAAKGPVKGSSQWSKEKVMMLVRWLNVSK